MDGLTRRHLIRRAALASGALALGPAFWQRAVASAATVTDGPYGPLGPPDELGIRLPAGFKSRLIARGLQPVPGTSYPFPVQCDGQTTYATRDGGWILVTNSESPPPAGGASAIRFNPDGSIADAYRILAGTTLNCSGGRTPWGTWLSGEEVDESEYSGGPFPPAFPLDGNPFRGAVWECDPTQPSQGVRRPALGLFKHEAVCVDPVGQRLYLTEDLEDGCFYRFTPELYPDLGAGLLEVAIVAGDGSVTWAEVPNPTAPPGTTATREQVEGATRFERGEGIWFDSGMVYIATTRDSRIHAYDTVAQRHEVIYDGKAQADGPLTDPDNITVSPSGDLLICENTDGSDGGLDIALLTPDLTISRFVRVEGPRHIYDAPELGPSELTGVVFDPSGTRMYFTSQRARTVTNGDEPGPGEVYEVTGPFRMDRPRSGPLSPGNPREAGQSIGPGQGTD
nr:PhoX family protein [Actinomycetota bacterium]